MRLQMELIRNWPQSNFPSRSNARVPSIVPRSISVRTCRDRRRSSCSGLGVARSIVQGWERGRRIDSACGSAAGRVIRGWTGAASLHFYFDRVASTRRTRTVPREAATRRVAAVSRVTLAVLINRACRGAISRPDNLPTPGTRSPALADPDAPLPPWPSGRRRRCDVSRETGA